jgi:RNA polymerase sigma factor (sigma-70 family)
MGTSTEQERFEKLIEANQGMIFKICNIYCRNQADREDLAQEIVFALWKGRQKYNPDFKFSTWMYRVALNVAISYYRRSKKTENTVPFSENHLNIKNPESDLPDRRSEAILLCQEVLKTVSAWADRISCTTKRGK